MSSKLILKVAAGPIAGERFVFDSHDTFLFGRHGDCHARLPNDGLVSRHHFLLEVNPPEARLRDLGSLNGTLVNGRQCGGRRPDESPEEGALRAHPQVDLQDGDMIVVGDTQIHVRVERAAPPVDSKIGEDPTIARESVSPTALFQRSDTPSLGEFPGASPGFQLPGYVLKNELGQGGMGIVYLAHATDNPRQRFAVKLMLARAGVSKTARRKFLREAGVHIDLAHPNIVRCHAFGSQNRWFHFVMEYCNGGNLLDFANRSGGQVPFARALALMLQCLAGLAHAHESGLVHRDLKPENILLKRTPAGMTAKIADFGLAKCFELAGLSGMTATNEVGGTWKYMPREQITNFKYLQPASDVWSVAATFFRILTGRHARTFPLHRDPIHVILNEDCTPIQHYLPDLPSRIANVFDRALACDPTGRYANAGELRSAVIEAM